MLPMLFLIEADLQILSVHLIKSYTYDCMETAQSLVFLEYQKYHLYFLTPDLFCHASLQIIFNNDIMFFNMWFPYIGNFVLFLNVSIKLFNGGMFSRHVNSEASNSIADKITQITLITSFISFVNNFFTICYLLIIRNIFSFRSFLSILSSSYLTNWCFGFIYKFSENITHFYYLDFLRKSLMNSQMNSLN